MAHACVTGGMAKRSAAMFSWPNLELVGSAVRTILQPVGHVVPPRKRRVDPPARLLPVAAQRTVTSMFRHLIKILATIALILACIVVMYGPKFLQFYRDSF